MTRMNRGLPRLPVVRSAATNRVAQNTAAGASQVAAKFYKAFSSRDSATMAQMYAKNVQFQDPLFGKLKGPQVMEMWNSITPATNPKTFKIEPKVLPNPTQRADGAWDVKVHWDAHYDLGSRHIDNHSDTTLTIKDGKIVGQKDQWDLDAWTKQALPFGGGNRVGDAIAHFAAHSFIEVKDLLSRL